MGTKIKIDDLQRTVNKALSSYSSSTAEAIEAAEKKIAKEAVSELKATSPAATDTKAPGTYRKGWRSNIQRSRLGCSLTIYNKEGSLTHLLEKGHALRQGGRSPAQPHIKKVADSAEESFVEELKERIEGIDA